MWVLNISSFRAACGGYPTGSSFRAGGKGLKFDFARGVLFELLDFYIRLGQLFLTQPNDPRALLVFREQGFERQIIGLHRFHDGFKIFQRRFKRQAALGRVTGLGWF